MKSLAFAQKTMSVFADISLLERRNVASDKPHVHARVVCASPAAA